MSDASARTRSKSEAMQQRLALLNQAMGDVPAHGGQGLGATEPSSPPPPHRPAASSEAARPGPARRAATGMWLSAGLLLMTGGWLVLQHRPAPAAPPPPPQAAEAPAPQPTASAPPAHAPSAAATDAAVKTMLDQWRMDWSRRDVTAYLSHYSASFEASDGRSRSEWELHRSQQLLKRSAIRVELADVQLEHIDAQRVRARFLQTYLSGPYQESAQPKTLLLVREDDRWRIAGEWQGAGPAASGKAS